jgi:4-oxalocrotonate tautomerase
MPIVNIKVTEGVFTPDEKDPDRRTPHRRDGQYRGRDHARVTRCVIEEVKSGGWAVGGQCLTIGVVHAPAAGN